MSEAIQPAARATPWRTPDRPREEPCVTCGAAAPCGVNGAWFCLECVPDDWFAPEKPS